MPSPSTLTRHAHITVWRPPHLPEGAAILRVEESWLRRHIKSLPHSKKGRVVTFSDDDLNRTDAQFHHEPTAGLVPARPVGVSGSHPMAHLVPLPSRMLRRESQ